MAFLAKLPSDILGVIKSFTNNTRLDWRTCKTREAALIRSLEGNSVLEVYRGENYDVEPEMMNWSLFGRMFISKSFQMSPGWHARNFAPSNPPPDVTELDGDDRITYRRWYLLEYRWVNYGQEGFNAWMNLTA